MSADGMAMGRSVVPLGAAGPDDIDPGGRGLRCRLHTKCVGAVAQISFWSEWVSAASARSCIQDAIAASVIASHSHEERAITSYLATANCAQRCSALGWVELASARCGRAAMRRYPAVRSRSGVVLHPKARSAHFAPIVAFRSGRAWPAGL